MKNIYSYLVVGACIALMVCSGCKKDNPVAPQQSSIPQIVSFSPQCGIWGQQIVITAKGVDPDTVRDKFYFTSVSSSTNLVLAKVDSIIYMDSVARVYVRVPTLASTGPIILLIDGDSIGSQAPFKYTAPISPLFKSYQPHAGVSGTLVTVTGTGFDTSSKNSTVLVNKDTAIIISASATQLQFRIPSTVKTGAITVLMDCDSIVLQGAFSVIPDSIISFSPHIAPSGYPDTIITNMHIYDTTGLVIKFGGVPAIITSVNDSMIVALVPPNAVTAPISVTWGGQMVTSENPFIIDSGLYVPYRLCAIQVGNILVKEHLTKYEGYTTSSNDTIIFSGEISNSTSCAGTPPELCSPVNVWDTLTFCSSYSYLTQNGSTNCSNTENIVIDTVAHVFRFVSGTESYSEEAITDLTSSFQYFDIPYVVSNNGSLIGEIDGMQMNGSLISYSYNQTNYYGNGHQYFRGDDINFLNTTDSSYIRITLTP